MELVAVLENLAVQENFSAEEKFLLLKNTLLTEIKNMTRQGTKSRVLALNLVQRLDKDVTTAEDVIIFCVAMKYLVAPINRAMLLVPSDDKKFCEMAAKNILDTFGEEKIDSLIATWDDLGVKGCLDAERALVIEEFTRLVENLSTLKIAHDSLDDTLILTAFVQEFEVSVKNGRHAAARRLKQSQILFSITTASNRRRLQVILTKTLRLTSGLSAKTVGLLESVASEHCGSVGSN